MGRVRERHVRGGTIQVEHRDGLVRARGVRYGTAKRFAAPEPPAARQIWVAGGVGATPFVAWLEALQAAPTREADLHYCTRDRDADAMVGRLQTLCAALPGIALTIHSARHGDVLSAASLKLAKEEPSEVWFCGPSGLAEALKKGLSASWNDRWHFHQEAFEMR